MESNREGVPAPTGGQWNASTINGSAKRASGILQNRLCIGEIVYGRQKFEKNPNTGTRIAKVVAEGDWLVEKAPHLAIIDENRFARVQAQRRNRSVGRSDRQRRPKHLFSGIVKCACCGGPMIVVKPGRLGCSYFRNRGTCRNNITITVREIEGRILKVIEQNLLAPELVAAAVKEYQDRRELTASQRAREGRQAQRDLAAVETKISRIVRAIEDGTASPTLTARLGELESERQRLLASTKEEVPSNVLALHPSIADRYRQKVSDIQTALRQNDESAREAVALVRELISAILVKPTSSGGNGLEIEGNFATLLFGGRTDGMTTEASASRYQLFSGR